MPPEPDSLPAAVAALRAAFEPGREEAMTRDVNAEDGDEFARARHEALMDELWAGHERALRAIAIEDREEMCATKIAVGLREFPNGEYEAAVEQMLQAGAAAAESFDKLDEAILALLAKMEEQTPEEIDAMTAEQFERFSSVLELLRENRDALLENLSLEQRRAWERRLGLEGEPL